MATITEDEYRRLKRSVEDAQREADRAQGALDQLMKRLKDEFKCTTLKEARTLLDELKGKAEKAEAAYTKAVTDYEKKWKEAETE